MTFIVAFCKRETILSFNESLKKQLGTIKIN